MIWTLHVFDCCTILINLCRILVVATGSSCRGAPSRPTDGGHEDIILQVCTRMKKDLSKKRKRSQGLIKCVKRKLFTDM